MNLLTSPRIPSLNTTLGTNAFQRWAFDEEAMSPPNHNTGLAVYPHCLWGKSCLSWCHFFFSFHKPVCLSSLVSVISSLCWILVPWLPMGVTRNPPPSLPFPSLPSLFYLTSHQIYSWISTHRSSSRVSFGNFFHCKTFFSCVLPETMTFWALRLLLWQFIRCPHSSLSEFYWCCVRMFHRKHVFVFSSLALPCLFSPLLFYQLAIVL